MLSVSQSGSDHQFQSKRILSLVISLFFLWALTSDLLPIFIPHFKKAFNLHHFKASLAGGSGDSDFISLFG